MKEVFKSIGWFRTIFVFCTGVFMLIGGIDGCITHGKYIGNESVELNDLKKNYKDGNYVKLTSFYADFKNRVRGLQDKTVAKDLTLLIPLRLNPDDQKDSIRYLLVLPNQSTIIDALYEQYQSERLDMQFVDSLVVEVSEIDELPGDVPESVRKNRKVTDDVVILWYKVDDPAYTVFLVFSAIFLVYLTSLIIIHNYKLKKSRKTVFYE